VRSPWLTRPRVIRGSRSAFPCPQAFDCLAPPLLLGLLKTLQTGHRRDGTGQEGSRGGNLMGGASLRWEAWAELSAGEYSGGLGATRALGERVPRLVFGAGGRLVGCRAGRALPSGRRGPSPAHRQQVGAEEDARLFLGWTGASVTMTCACSTRTAGCWGGGAASAGGRHASSRAKSDRGDAKVLAELVRTDRHNHRRVAGDSEAVKVLARAHQSLIWARQRHVNALRSALREFYPGAWLRWAPSWPRPSQWRPPTAGRWCSGGRTTQPERPGCGAGGPARQPVRRPSGRRDPAQPPAILAI
jgi:hypothetical protein